MTMTVERVVAAPYKQTGADSLTEQEFVVALSLHRDWFSPAQAKRVVKMAVTDGLLEQREDGLFPVFDPGDVEVPNGFEPDDGMLTRRSAFEAILERLVEAGEEKRAAVAGINRLQQSLGVTIDAAAAVYATRQGVDVADEVARAAQELRSRSE